MWRVVAGRAVAELPSPPGADFGSDEHIVAAAALAPSLDECETRAYGDRRLDMWSVEAGVEGVFLVGVDEDAGEWDFAPTSPAGGGGGIHTFRDWLTRFAPRPCPWCGQVGHASSECP